MNFLELCRQVKEEAGLAGAAISTVSSTTGIDTKIVKWVQQAWLRIQSQYMWRTLQAELTFTTTIGQRDYDVAVDLLHTDVQAFDVTLAKISDGTTTNGLQWLDYFNQYRPKYFFAVAQSGRPSEVTYSPFDNKVRFNTNPDAAYTVTLPYIMTAEKLASDADVPTLSEQHHWMIVWRAVMFYAAYDNAPVLFQTARENYMEMLTAATDGLIGPISNATEPLA